MVFKQREHKLFIKLRVMGQASAIPTDKAGIRTNPKSSVSGAEQFGDCSARQVLTRRRLPGDAAIAIESKQTEFRAEPKITIGRLCNGVDITLEESLTDWPRGVGVLINVEGRI
jgi:hypothetical protein